MSSGFLSAVFGSSVVYPNAVDWSEENLLAVACGNTISILNPANPGVRGVVTVPHSKPFPVGMIDRGEDLKSGCLLPFNLSRDTHPCVRSISWSPVGLSNSGGCLLAVCTTAGSVKLYRLPFREFLAEWIEVLDVSQMMYNYFKSSNFGEDQIASTGSLDVTPRRDNTSHECANSGQDQTISTGSLGVTPRRDNTDHECANDSSAYRLRYKRRKNNAVAATNPDDSGEDKDSSEDSTWKIVPEDKDSSEDNTWQSIPEDKDSSEDNTWKIIPRPSYKAKTREKVGKDCNLPLITVQQYASRNEMMMSLTMAWSPILWTSEHGVSIHHNSSSCCSILAVGGKCGRISFWRVHAPECYSIENTRYPNKVLLVGLLKAHESWITAIDWALYGSNVSKTPLLLATGSSDGRVKIWKVNGDKLLQSSEVIDDSCVLWDEVVTVDPATISVLSLTVPSQSLSKLLLAIGKASGSFEVWVLHISINNFEKVGCYNAHDRIVTGLTWAFEGRCLFSCSQDNSVKSWILVGNSLQEISFPSNNPGLKSSPEVPFVFDSCLGLAVSPGNMAIAVVRNFDINLLHPMYQGRTHRAAVEFLWIGGLQLDLSSTTCPDMESKRFSGFPEKELTWWESNIIWSLKQYEDPSKVLNLWDIVATLLAFKQWAPEYVERVLLKWLTSYFGPRFGMSTSLLPVAFKILPKISSRQLHLINIISRRVVLKEGNADSTISKQQDFTFWTDLLSSSENELLERLVGVTLSGVLHHLSDSSMESGCWSRDGLSQMEQWISSKKKSVKNHSRFLAAQVEKRRSVQEQDEQCNFCSADVPFESTEYGMCSSSSKRHRLERCAVSMRLLPNKPSWHCICCRRRATKFAPTILFTMPQYPSDFMSLLHSCDSSIPRCPFCGILLQRSQPQHSLSPSPV